MARTQLSAKQVLDGSLTLEDFNTTTPGSALITKVVAGTGINISSTGADPGTGVVTINATSGGASTQDITKAIDGLKTEMSSDTGNLTLNAGYF